MVSIIRESSPICNNFTNFLGGFQTDNGQPNPAGSFVESTIIVQYDPLVQEVWDQARKLRCTWYDYYEKSVTFRPFQVSKIYSEIHNFKDKIN